MLKATCKKISAAETKMRGFRALLGGNSFYPTKKLKIFVGVPFRETYPLDSRFKVVAAVENFYFEFCVIERNFCRIVRAYPDGVLFGSHSELRARLRRFSEKLVEFRILKPVVVEKPLFIDYIRPKIGKEFLETFGSRNRRKTRYLYAVQYG